MTSASKAGMADLQGDHLGAEVELDNLQLAYDGQPPAVSNLSLSVAAGEFVSLLGPSGSGKTTTLKMLAGFETQDSGEIRVGGLPMRGVPPAKRNIGMVFQNYALFPHMSVYDNIAFPLRMHKRPADEVNKAVFQALDLVQLQPLAQRFPKQLSGGQQQRVALARAIVFRPPLLLMDEPLGALDRQLRKSVQYELKRIQRRLGLTVIYVTHDQEEALFLFDRIAIMEVGKLAQVGQPPVLYQHPSSRFVAEFLGESNFLSGEIIGRDGQTISLRLPDGTVLRGMGIGLEDYSGSAVDVLIRPEKLDVLDVGTPHDKENRLPGMIAMLNFMGSQQEYEVETAGGTLTARSYLRSDFAARPNGTSVTLAFSSGDCLVFPAKGGS